MALSSDLMSLFVKTTKDNSKPKTESTAYGTVVKQGNETWVQLDGSDLLTPFTTTADVKDGERVVVTIKNHTATVTGNTTEPAGRHQDIVDVDDKVDKLDADKIDADLIVADEAILNKLKSDEIDVLSLIADKAVIQELVAENANLNTLEAKNAYLRYVQIDRTNIDQAWIKDLYAESGIISSAIIEDGTITGDLVGVRISADSITSGTLSADRLFVRGDNGLYYRINVDAMGETAVEEMPEEEQEKLKNGIHGSNILAESITADKMKVTDLTAFGAKIAGFTIAQPDEESDVGRIYSGSKSFVDSDSIRGLYFDTLGQFSLGDNDNYVKFYKVVNPETGEDVLDTKGKPVYKLAISAESITFGGGDSKDTAANLKTLTEHVKIGTIVDETGDEKPCVELSEGDSDFKQVITNTKTIFMDGQTPKTQIDTEGVKTDNLVVDEEFRQGNFVWETTEDGGYGLSWREVTS